MIHGEIEELTTQLEAAERARKAAEGELAEATDKVTELTANNSGSNAARRKLESDLQVREAGVLRRRKELEDL